MGRTGRCRSRWLVATAAALALAPALAADVQDILNYRAYSATLSSAGQPTEKQLSWVADAGFERVIYLAFSDHDRALEHEDLIVETLGMDFVHIPVLWGSPGRADFEAFAAVLNSAAEVRTLVHCELNFRASSFTFLYRVLYGEEALDEALEDLQSVWAPTESWQAFIFDTLEAYGVDPDCDACMW